MDPLAAELVTLLTESIGDRRVLDAVGAVPRAAFVPEGQRDRAYENVALEIGHEQTISQPYVVARMLELLELQPTDRVLDVGTGTGYHAALLARLAGKVVSVERDPQLSCRAARTLSELRVENVVCLVADGWHGWPAAAPYDAINVAAAPGDRLPAALGEQLAIGGRLVVPLGSEGQRLTRIRRRDDGLSAEAMDPVRFVPLVPEP